MRPRVVVDFSNFLYYYSTGYELKLTKANDGTRCSFQLSKNVFKNEKRCVKVRVRTDEHAGNRQFVQVHIGNL